MPYKQWAHTIGELRIDNVDTHLTSPIVGMFTNTQFLPTLLEYGISDSANYSRRHTFTSHDSGLQRFNIRITHANFIASVKAVDVLGFLVYLPFSKSHNVLGKTSKQQKSQR